MYLLNTAKQKYYSDKIEESQGDQRKLFKLVKSIMKPEENVKYPVSSSMENLTNEFNEYFITKIDLIREKLDEIEMDTSPAEYLMDYKQVKEFSVFERLSEDQVKMLIMKSPNKQCAADPIPTWMLKECLDIILPFLGHTVNLSLQTGHFADAWKEALLSPLLKNSTLDIVFPNFRPVSNLPFVSKLVERCSSEQVLSHMSLNCPLPVCQSAYTKNCSTETALLKVTSDILSDMDDNKVTLLVMLDLSAAFDTIDHSILLETLRKKVGISGKALDWFLSYLSNRSQRVQISNVVSDREKLKYGVPQGSCLGPILFLIYASTLFNVIEQHLPNAHCYADDHQIYLSFKPVNQTSQEEALHVIQNCVKDVRKWMLVNKLKINDSKTEFLIIGSKHQLSQITIDSIKIGDSEIKPVTSVKNLGVLIDNNLSMESHITKTCSAAFYHIYNIKHIRKYLTRDLTEKIVHALITSKLDYCNSLLFGLSNSQLQKLQRVQNAAARIITGTRKYDHITPVLRELHWLPVKERIDFKILLLTFKALNNMAPAYLKDMLRLQTSDRCKLRSEKSVALIVPRTKFTSRGDRAFCTAAPRVWNKLPVEIRRSQSVHTFKTRLKTHLFDNHFNI